MKRKIKRILAVVVALITFVTLYTPLNSKAANDPTKPSVSYRVRTEDHVWLKYKKDGKISGRYKENKRIEAIRMKVDKQQSKLSGHIKYKASIEHEGWTNWFYDGKRCGTVNQGLRLESFRVKITGKLAKAYDVYYRANVQNMGWLGWAKNGQAAGVTSEVEMKVIGIQVKLIKKEDAKPVNKKPALVSDYSLIPGNFSIYVNKQMNCVTIYKGEVPIKAMACSTGAATPLGSYSIGQKYRWHALIHGVYGQYCCRVVGSILFHSVPYSSMNDHALLVDEYNKLGTTASAGCIRLTVADAKWIHDNAPAGTPVVIYNNIDPGPLGKPTTPVLPSTQTWDPTDEEAMSKNIP